MYSFSSALLISLGASLLILRWSAGGARTRPGIDHDLIGMRKTHAYAVPRIGGVAVFLAIVAGCLLVALRDPGNATRIGLLCLCATPAFIGGLAEDLSGRVSPGWRITCMIGSCLMAFWLLDLQIVRVDIAWLDSLLTLPVLGMAFTLLALVTLTNAVNIIDGFHGLAGMVSSIMFLGLATVGLKVGDSLVVSASLMMIGALAGFLIWNYPRGRILLGDGGAYFVGFMLGALSILVVGRNAAVSAWFPVLLLAYPLVEISFTVYRRKVLRDLQPHLPDAAHLHQLIFRRVVRWASGRPDADARTVRNALTAPYLWVLSSMAVGPAVLWFDRTEVLAPLFALFVASYVWLYFRIVRLKVPRWLVVWRK